MNSETIATQQIIIEVDLNTTIIGEAPQYKYISDVKTNVTTAMPYWSIKKVLKSGTQTIIRNAEGDEFHNKILDDWSEYTY